MATTDDIEVLPLARQPGEGAFPSERPLCKCHGEPMKWQKDKRCTRTGGFWSCSVKAREYNARYFRTEKGRAALRRGSAKTIDLRVGGVRIKHHFESEEAKAAALQKIREFRAEQRASYRTEAGNGWIDKAEPRT